MTRHASLRITAILTIAAALMAVLTITALSGVHQAHPSLPVAGIVLNAID